MTGKLLFAALEASALEPGPYMHVGDRVGVDDDGNEIPATGYGAVTLDSMFDLDEAARLLTEWLAKGER